MIIEQISVFLENRAGQLAEITDLLAGHGIDLLAANIAETNDYGVLRLVTADPEQTARVLQQGEYVFHKRRVVAAAVPDFPGGLNQLLQTLAQEQVDINYLYSIFGKKDGKACMILRTDDPDRLNALLSEKGFDVGNNI